MLVSPSRICLRFGSYVNSIKTHGGNNLEACSENHFSHFCPLFLQACSNANEAMPLSKNIAGAKPSQPNAPVEKPSTVRTSTFDFYTLTNLETKGEVSSIPYAHSSGSCIIGVDTSKGADGKVYVLSNLNCGLRDSIGVGKNELPVGPARSLEGWFIGNQVMFPISAPHQSPLFSAR